MKRILPVVMAFVLVLALGGTAAAEEPRTHTLSPGEGTLVEMWQPGIVPIMEVTFTVAGTVEITGGWVFDTPLKINDEVVETVVVPGETAQQISPFTRTVSAGETWIWEPTQAEYGSELGVRYTYSKEAECQIVEVYPGWEQGSQTQWEGDISNPCVRMEFRGSGQMRVRGGWVYTTPVTMNGAPVATYTVPGESAQQISAFTINVEDGEVWEWRATRLESGSELGVWFDFVKVLYLPTVRNH